jgi:hypothetical protein
MFGEERVTWNMWGKVRCGCTIWGFKCWKITLDSIKLDQKIVVGSLDPHSAMQKAIFWEE